MKRILILGNYEEAMYHPLSGVEDRLKEIFNDFEITCTNDSGVLLSSSEYDGVISYWDDWNNPVAEFETAALCEYVENGGALLILHNGISLQLREDFKQLVGGKFLTHPKQEVITFVPGEDDIASGCEPFALMEEPYQFEFEDDNKEMILSYTYQDKSYPAGWKKTYGAGKLIYLTPGHTAEKFDVPAYQKLIRQSMLWCMAE